jgi:RimJ/RimL family protein N-acetyltransferase
MEHPMDFTARAVTEADISAICRWPQNDAELYYCFPKASYPLSPEQLADAIAQRAESTIIEIGGEAVAFANFYRWDHGGVCCIGNVIVSPAARRLGAAAFLMTHMCAVAFRTYEASQVRVSCFNQNTAGLLLYSSLGFQPFAIEERRDKNGARVALVHLQRSTA